MTSSSTSTSSLWERWKPTDTSLECLTWASINSSLTLSAHFTWVRNANGIEDRLGNSIWVNISATALRYSRRQFKQKYIIRREMSTIIRKMYTGSWTGPSTKFHTFLTIKRYEIMNRIDWNGLIHRGFPQASRTLDATVSSHTIENVLQRERISTLSERKFKESMIDNNDKMEQLSAPRPVTIPPKHYRKIIFRTVYTLMLTTFHSQSLMAVDMNLLWRNKPNMILISRFGNTRDIWSSWQEGPCEDVQHIQSDKGYIYR